MSRFRSIHQKCHTSFLALPTETTRESVAVWMQKQKSSEETAVRKQQLRKHLIIVIRQSSQVTFNYIALYTISFLTILIIKT